MTSQSIDKSVIEELSSDISSSSANNSDSEESKTAKKDLPSQANDTEQAPIGESKK